MSSETRAVSAGGFSGDRGESGDVRGRFVLSPREDRTVTAENRAVYAGGSSDVIGEYRCVCGRSEL